MCGLCARRAYNLTSCSMNDDRPPLVDGAAQICLFWGSELIKLYNDSYIPVLGNKHAGALGHPARARDGRDHPRASACTFPKPVDPNELTIVVANLAGRT